MNLFTYMFSMKKIKYNIIALALVLHATLLFSNGITDLAEKITADFVVKIEKKILHKKRLAIFEFKDLSTAAKKYHISKTVQSLLLAEFNNSLIFALVERTGLTNILKEIELGQTGLLAENSVTKVGQLSGAQYLMNGSVTEVKDYFLIYAQIISSTTGEILSAQKINLPKDEILITAKRQYWSSFQSNYGLSFGIENMFLIANKKFNNSIHFTTLMASYRLHRMVKVGVGYSFGGGNEIIREDLTLLGNPIKRNYNISASGAVLAVDFLYPIFPWLNLGVQTSFTALWQNNLEQDLAGFPVYVDTGTNNVLESRRLLVNGWATEDGAPYLYSIMSQIQILVSKRLSVIFKMGYVFALTFTPFIYEANGFRQWGEDADQNGTFTEYQNFNFSRNGDNERVSFDLSGYAFSFGLGVHF